MTHQARFLFTGWFGSRLKDQEFFSNLGLTSVGGPWQRWQTAVRDSGGRQRAAIAAADSSTQYSSTADSGRDRGGGQRLLIVAAGSGR